MKRIAIWSGMACVVALGSWMVHACAPSAGGGSAEDGSESIERTLRASDVARGRTERVELATGAAHGPPRSASVARAAPHAGLSAGALSAKVDELLAADRLGDARAIERAIEAALAAWGEDPAFPDVLFGAIAATEDPDGPRARALAVLVRSWLAVAGARGECNPDGARRFVRNWASAAFDGDRPALRRMLRHALAESDDAAPGHQLVGLPELGDLLLAHLPGDGQGRTDALELMRQWSQRRGPLGERFLRGLLTLPGEDLHAIAFQGLLALGPQHRDTVLAEAAVAGPRVVDALAAFAAQRPHLVPAEHLLAWLGTLGPEAFPHDTARRLGLVLLPRLDDGGALADRVYRSWSARPNDPRAASLRILALRAALLVDAPGPRWRDLLFEATLDADPEIASQALLGLGKHFPHLALGRLIDLASAADAAGRRTALWSAGNALRTCPSDEARLDPLFALLADPRLPLAERAGLAGELERLRPDAVRAWRRQYGLE